MVPVYVYPRDFHRCVDHVCWKLQQLAGSVAVPDDECCDLEATLAALPPGSRSLAEAMLNGVKLSAADEFPAMAFAASYVLKLAREIWHEPAVRVAAMAGAPNVGSLAVDWSSP